MESGLPGAICTAGSVDDGKSTLIGRLLYDSQSVYEDQVASVAKASKNRNAGRSTSRCSPTACAPSASRASRSTSPTATSQPRGASSSLLIRRGTSNTRATWPPARRRRTSRSCSSTRGTAFARSRSGTRESPGCSASPTSCSPSTRWTSWVSIARSTRRSRTTSASSSPALRCTRSR